MQALAPIHLLSYEGTGHFTLESSRTRTNDHDAPNFVSNGSVAVMPVPAAPEPDGPVPPL